MIFEKSVKIKYFYKTLDSNYALKLFYKGEIIIKKKNIYLDLGAINKAGVKSFLKSHNWPVSEKKFRSVVNLIYERYYHSLKGLRNEDYYIGIIETRFIGYLIQVLHYNYAKNFAEENNIKIYHSYLSKDFLTPDWKKIGDFYNSYSYPYNKIQRFFRKIVKSLYFNRHLPLNKIFFGLINKKKFLSLGSFDKIKKNFIYNTKNYYYHIEWVDIIAENNLKNINEEKLLKKINYFSEIVLNPILKMIQLNRISKKFTKGLDFEIILSSWKNRITDIYKINYSLKLSTNVNQLLITECGNPFHKLIGALYKSKNTTVVNFTHGNDFCFIDKRWTHNYLMSTCNYYVFETNKISNAFAKNRSNLMLDFKEKVKYTNIKKSNFFQLNNNYLNNKKNNKEIMLIGYPMNVMRYTDDAYCFFHYRLKLELHLLKELNKTKFDITYKAHPDRLKELGNIYNTEVKKINSQKLENIWEESEALVFTYATTTTFGFALTRPIPIILIAPESNLWIKKRKKLLENRVSFLSPHNEFNYKEINYKKLQVAIEEAKNKINVNKFNKLIN